VGIKILLADDSVTAQNMGKKILSDAGHEVVTVSNGAAAAKKIAEIKPELVLLDVFMPGYSGLELCEKLRSSAETSKLPVLLTVGRMEPYNSQDGARVKADGVIVKPFEASDLTAAVDRLADKAKPKHAGDAPKIKIVPKAEPTDTTTRLEAEAAESTPPAQEVSTAKIEVQATPAYPAEDFQVAPAMPAADIASLEQSPARVSAEQPSIPSYMSQYLAEPAAGEAAKPEIAPEPEPFAVAPGLSIHDQPTVAFPKDFLQAHSQNEFTVSQPIETQGPPGALDGLELTSAPPVPEMPVTPEPGLELTLHPGESDSAVAKDPALVTDPHRSTMDFPTRFGSSEAELAQKFMESLHASAEPVVDSSEDFEARLGAAMASYEEPGGDLPPIAEQASSNVIEMRPHFPAEPAPSLDGLEARVDNAMHDFELPELGAESAPQSEDVLPVGPADLSSEPPRDEIELSPFSEHSARQTPEYLHHVEAVSSSATAPLDAAETADISDLAAQVVAPDPDDSLIQQMREGLSHVPETVHHPGEGSEPAPMAMAAAAGVEARFAAAPHRDPETEVARAMAAAMGRELTSESIESAAVESQEVVHETDANSLASAVETVMKRELPNLIWKIMAELDLRKRQ